MNTIGKRIRFARKSNNLSLTDVNALTGLSTGNLSELENDKFSPSANALIALKKVLNVSIDWILTGNDSNNNSTTICEQQSLYLSDKEKELIELYRTIPKENQRDLLGYLNVISVVEKKNT
ncbi:helix-turn-helix protein [Natranaerovirga hydrolytica]|uniref:Helix-turn-helix protein n=1 Tax=Natranaerovirga hydrolytica TaxID=680378 RepID=A0A4R1MDQ4_9FIRM|nr:helix-turn-helix domain-containing protein [Natranaerovirga hydrolytica]TCK90596.1 helix-turn-helix protein [Natranaerovirga hydrolytica]